MDIDSSDFNNWGDEEFQDEDISPSHGQEESAGGSRPAAPTISSAQIAAMRRAQVERAVTDRVTSMLLAKEEELDEKMNRMENMFTNMKGEELEELRARRQEELERRSRQNHEFLQQGHGKITELKDTREFFTMVKASRFAIVLFYSKTSKWCNMLREHLTLLCRCHLSCRFLEVNAENVPYLIDKLSIFMMPTLLLVKDRRIEQQLRGLDWVAPDGHIDTQVLEDRLHAYGFFEECKIGSSKGKKNGKKGQSLASATMQSVVDGRGDEDDDSDGLDLD